MTDSQLFSFDEGQSDILWMSDALEQKLVEPRQKIACTMVILTSTEKGFMLVGELPDGTEVYDFIWRKSKPGKQMFSCFEDPTVLDGARIEILAQTKMKTAVFNTVAEKGAKWHIGSSEGRTALLFTGKPVGKSLSQPAQAGQ